ncbi:MAG TPA: DUF4136 domain-containing protein [Cyclobacteriaceae bacterium]|jgi:hypothetical protein|nr:DUF4136 domain-containing protein [Cyclobacteriaceae bacterium]
MIKKIAALILLVICYGCSERIRAYSEYDHEFHLGEYSTFNWAKKIHLDPGKDSLFNTGENEAKMKSAVRRQLEVRGYKLTPDLADFKVYSHIIVNDQTVMTPEPYGFNYSPYWIQLGTNTFPYGAGTIIIDVLDTKTNNLTWRGWAVAPMEDLETPEKVDELITTAIGKIFKKFPNTPKHTFVRDDKL